MRDASFDAGFEIGGHDHGDQRPREIGTHEDKGAEREAPADLLSGEFWFGSSYGHLLCEPSKRAIHQTEMGSLVVNRKVPYLRL